MTKKKARKVLVALYILAAIGTWTVCANIYSAGCSAAHHASAWWNSLSWEIPTVVDSGK